MRRSVYWKWFAALVVGLFLVGTTAGAFAGEEGGDPPGHGHHHGHGHGGDD